MSEILERRTTSLEKEKEMQGEKIDKIEIKIKRHRENVESRPTWLF
jgi:hypothetical protein